MEGKQRFYGLCIEYGIDYVELTKMSDLAKVSHESAKDMFIGNAVAKKDAESLLVIFSQITGKIFSLDNVSIPLLPQESEAPHDQLL